MDSTDKYSNSFRRDVFLTDPQTCGEDLVGNLNIVAQLAPEYCRECDGQHMRYTTSRLTQKMTAIDYDRGEIIQFITKIIGDHWPNRTSAIDVLIPGAGDTGILATCAHAFASANESRLAPVYYTVLDICETPLALCRAYGAQHKIDVATRRIDLTAPDATFQADLIVLHSIFRQIPPQFYEPLLREMANWMRPQGRVIFSNALRAPPRIPREKRIEFLSTRLKSDGTDLTIPLDQVVGAVVDRRRPVYHVNEPDELRPLFHDAGFAIEDELIIEKPTEGEVGGPIRRRYVAQLALR